MKSAIIGVIGLVAAGAIGTTYVVGNQKHATAEKSATSVSRVSKKFDLSTESSSSSEQSSSTVATSSSKQASAISSSATAPAAKSMDLSAIQNGDFSSVVGTWKNDKGDSFTIDKDGIVQVSRDGRSFTEKVFVNYASFGPNAPAMYNNVASADMKDGHLRASMGEYPISTDPDDPEYLSEMSFIPKGQVFPDTDSSVERIFSGQSIESENIYYRV